MVDDADQHARGFAAMAQFVERGARDLQRHVPGTAGFLKDGTVLFIGLGVRELKERQSATVADLEEGVAIIDLAADFGTKGALAPGGDQGNAEDILDEMPVRFLVFHRECMMVHAQRQLFQHWRPPALRRWQTRGAAKSIRHSKPHGYWAMIGQTLLPVWAGLAIGQHSE